MATNHFTQLRVWRKAHALTLDVYRATKGFPPDERYVLAPQLRRAALSIQTNLAEGYGRRSAPDKGRFYTMALASAHELERELLVSKDLGYLREPAILIEQTLEVARMLRGLEGAVLRSAQGD